MRRAIALIASAAVLSGCSLLFPEDPRLGEEEQGACVTRVSAALPPDQKTAMRDLEGIWVPTYTYDVTKLDLETIQELSVSNSDETDGTSLIQRTNETSTAREIFMTQPVDEEGVFFLGQEQGLYRVRGEPQPADKLVAGGCLRQRANMRLIALSWAPDGEEVEPDDTEAIDPNELDPRGEPTSFELLEKSN